jgi:hypothetical protein
MTFELRKFCHFKYLFCCPGQRHNSPPQLRSCWCTDIDASLLENQWWLKLAMWSRVMLQNLLVVRLLKISPLCVEIERSLLYSEEPTTFLLVGICFADRIVCCHLYCACHLVISSPVISGEEYTFVISFYCSFLLLVPPIVSSVLCTNNLNSTLWSNIPSVCSFLQVGD